MAKKTVQAMKINGSVVLENGGREATHKALFVAGPLAGVGGLVKVRLTFAHAIVARYDDPDYSARVTARIAEIKVALAALGDLENWYVVAGAVPAGDAEALADEVKAL